MSVLMREPRVRGLRMAVDFEELRISCERLALCLSV
jgi:hypothetical protein